METIITAATVLTMYFNAINSNDVNYLYNADMEDGKVNKIEVYEQKTDKEVCAKMEYHYEYDEQGRLTTREVMRWDDAKKAWVNDFRHTYKYYKNGYNMETSKWDAEKGAYDLPSEVTLYRSVAPSLTSVRTYRMNDAKNDMYLASKMIVMEPVDDRLFAGK